MKKYANYVNKALWSILLCAGLVITGCYDDSALQEQIGGVNEQLKDHESRLKELERLTSRQNANIESLQTIVTALQDKDYVTDVSPINEGDKVMGYTITFSKSGAVTIYNGKDGYVPVMGVKQDESDGQWYWTLDGEWMRDSKGDKVRASAIDGEDGDQGTPGQPGVTPTLKIVDGDWYVSYDGGKTWEEETLGQATGDNGDSMFEKVEFDDNYLYITMADGEKLTLPRTSTGQGEEDPLTWSLGKVTAATATFTGHLNVAASDLSFSQVTVYYSDAETFNVNAAESVSATSFDKDQNFTITLTNLKYNTKYNYCMVAEVKSEKTYGDVLDFTTCDVTFSEFSVVPGSFKAEVSGSIVGLSEEDKKHIEVAIIYSSEYGHVVGQNIKETEISADGVFSVLLSNLTAETTYYYYGLVYQGASYTYGTPAEFTTLKHPYDIQHDLNVSAATDMSSSGSANCYIVSESGLYKFKPVKGNSNESVGSVASASLLWETLGIGTAPECLYLISAFCYKDGYIAFQTADTFREGNAVIAAKDASGTILWSWHIWLTDQPQAHVYNNSAGAMMDRNLGATSATPGDVGALGLHYQWGRKDPFLGSSSLSYDYIAESTITWPSAVSSDSSNGTIAYATANPTTFIKSNSNNYDWYYTGSLSVDNTRWTTSERSKSIYDPCPAGWRVPDGGDNGIWSKAGFARTPFDSTNLGISFSISSPSTTWYPVSGVRSSSDSGLFAVGSSGVYWSASPDGEYAYCLNFNFYDDVYPAARNGRASASSVRCLQE